MKFDKNQAPNIRIKMLRIAAGKKQEELAAEVGCDQQHISDWEVGKHVVSDLYRKQLSAALGVEPKDIWG